MESFLLVVILIVLAIRWAILSRRYAAIEERIESLVRGRIDPAEITKLIRRITLLENSMAELKQGRVIAVQEVPVAAAPSPQPVPEPDPVPIPAPLEPEPEPVEAPAIVTAPEPAPEPIENPVAPPPLRPIAALAPVMAEPPRPARTSAEWEAMVGGNWLNKIGILFVVIAIALFLGYTVPRMGPGGISAVALTLSLTLLVSGALLERRAHYVVFAHGLLAGGWAGLYFTVYAMQALEAAKVIHNPVFGALLLLGVATGMVVHSLKYRSQTVTGLAYFVAFATLAITQVTTLSVIALVPLAASLLVVAYRFEWSGMALFGLAATYITCAAQGDHGAPLWKAQTVFAVYWLVFEAYDLLRTHRRSNHPAESAMLPLNALGFGLLSYAKWSSAAPGELYRLTIGIAAVYLASTILRAILRPPASFPAETGTLDRIFAGSFEGPVTLAAASSAAAAILKLHGQTVNNVLLAEGETLFLAGLFFRQSYLRRLSATLFAALGVKLFVTDLPDAGSITLAGRTLRDWTPSAVLAASLFYVNRALRKLDLAYGYAASALVALVVGYETPLRDLGIAWLILGAMLFLLGWRWRLLDFRIQGYLSSALAVSAIAVYQFQIASGIAAAPPHPWISLAFAAATAYAAALCALRSARDRFIDTEREQFEFMASAISTAALATLLWKIVPADYLGLAWMVQALVALELGLRRWPPGFRWHAQLLAALGMGQVLLFEVLPFHTITATPERIAVGGAALAAYLFAARMFVASTELVERKESRPAVDIASACGSFFVMVELWAFLSPMAVAPVWALFAVILTTAGFQLKLTGLRVQGHAVALTAFGRLFPVNFDAPHQLASVAVVIAAQYFEGWRQCRLRERLEKWEASLYRPYLYAAVLLVVCLMFRELPPPDIEIGWAALMLALLAVGRTIGEKDLRYQSYALAWMALGRALELEFPSSTIYEGMILASTTARIVAGASVVACLFCAQLLIERERRSRLYFSLLATALATAILYQEVSGSMLTVAWGIEGAVLLAIGFPLRDRTLRLSGLVLFLACVGKLFAYDLRALDTPYRILSFLVLGLILVGVSWVYTRFRDRILRYL